MKKGNDLGFVAILVALLMGATLLSPPDSFAQRYPDHPVQLVIPNPPGANMDIMGRMLAD
jgi:tripartite-type tricarboxylate transporter receptor subunit TctC